MFADLQLIDAKVHRTQGWKRQDHYRFAAGDAWAPLVIGELGAVLPSYPIALVERSGGGFQLVAVQGLHQGENLFLESTGKWRPGYIPSHYRGYPFALRDALVKGQRRGVLCFDFGSGLHRVTPDPARGEERFFDDAGQIRPFLEQVLRFFTQLSGNRLATDQAVEALSAAGVLAPWRLEVENPDPQRPLLDGLYRIEESALRGLDGPQLESLHNANALAVAYAQIFSRLRLGMLRKLYDLRAPQPALSDADLDAVFGEGGGDGFEFDFG